VVVVRNKRIFTAEAQSAQSGRGGNPFGMLFMSISLPALCVLRASAVKVFIV
jgi:hypothetical protein